MSCVSLGYGTGSMAAELPSEWCTETLVPVDLPGRPPGDMVTSLANPVSSVPLQELARGARSVAILVSGRDRVTRADVYLPAIFQCLDAAGVPAEGRRIVMATGTHIPFGANDFETVFGKDVDRNVEVVSHDCHSPDLVKIGETSLGNTIRVNRSALDADLRILTGRITHHYFAGFTAGRKSVLPGVCGYDTILRNHRLVLSGEGPSAVPTTVANGILEGNPVDEEMMEAAAFFQPSFVVNTVLNRRHEIAGIYAGNWVEAHAQGCEAVAAAFEVAIESPVPLAIGSCGGHPYDCSFIQAIKTLMNTHQCVADGGTYVLLAECPEGIRKGFLAWPCNVALPELAEIVRRDYNLTGHNLYLLRQILQRIRVVLVSQCPMEAVRHLGFEPAQRLDVALKRVFSDSDTRSTGATRCYVIPHGNVTVVKLARSRL